MKRLLALGIICILPLIQSCNEQGISVTDNSFGFTASVHTDAETQQSRVTLTLEKGESGRNYSIAFLIDGDPSLPLTSLTGAAETEKVSASFSDFPSCTWILPVLDEGKHNIVFKIRSDSYTQDLEIPFEVSVAPFSIHAEILTPASSSVTTLMINLVSGIPDRDYTGTVSVDGVCTDEKGFSVNFAKTPTLMLEIPQIRPGEHRVDISISDGRKTEEMSLRYDEPVRHPVMDIYISHDDETGKTRFMVHDNPYSLSFVIRDSLHVKGRCDYQVATFEDHTEDRREYAEASDGATLDRFIPADGRWYDLVDKDRTELEITCQGRQSTCWDRVWRTDSEGYWDYFIVDGDFVHFVITSSVQEITAEIEKMQGVTVNVHCTESGCVFNGKELSGDWYSFKL